MFHLANSERFSDIKKLPFIVLNPPFLTFTKESPFMHDYYPHKDYFSKNH